MSDFDVPYSELHETIDNYTVAFRIDFSTFSINKFHCAAIGNAEDYTMNLHVLDMDCKQFRTNVPKSCSTHNPFL